MISEGIAVFLAVESVDLRGAFDRLAAITRVVLQRDPQCGALFLFANRRRNRLKVLWWDQNGYTLLYKRLSKGTFPIPEVLEADVTSLELSVQDFSRLLSALPIVRSVRAPTLH